MSKVHVVRSAVSTVKILTNVNTPLSSNTVISQRPITTLEGLADVRTDELDSAHDGFVMVYDANLDKFILVDPDVVLSQSVEDGDLPDDFIDQLEQEIDLGNVQLDNVDGGGFV